LVRKFDGRKCQKGKERGKEIGWGMALMEMLVDPALRAWAPRWVVEQYERWNPHFLSTLRYMLRKYTNVWAIAQKQPGDSGVEERSEHPTADRVADRRRDMERRGYRTRGPEESWDRRIAADVASDLQPASSGARQELTTNWDLLWWTRVEMMRRYQRKKAREAAAKEAKEVEKGDLREGEGSGASSEGSVGGSSDHSDRGEEDPEQPVPEMQEVLRDPRPPVPGDAPDAGGVDDDWARATLEQQASASCVPGKKTADRVTAAPAPVVRKGVAAVNPPSSEYTWESIVSNRYVREWNEKWERWHDREVQGDEEFVETDTLNTWQRFAVDIAEYDAAVRDALDNGRPGCLRNYEPLRLHLSGDAGSGKSLTVRAMVGRRIRRAVRRLGFSAAESRSICALGAPTGCASFHMKYGASTVHRVFGVPVGYCGKMSKDSGRYKRVQKRLLRARLAIIDERSMVGRRFLGKTVYCTGQVLGTRPEKFAKDVSMGGLSMVTSGDDKQAPPILDFPQFLETLEADEEGNMPGKGKQRPADVPCNRDLSIRGLSLRDEFMRTRDSVNGRETGGAAVILRTVHRIDRNGPESANMTPEAQQQYAAEADKFLCVAKGLGNLTWTSEERDWLNERVIDKLARTEEGMKELEEEEFFQAAPLLMDVRVSRREGQDAADLRNRRELENVSLRTGNPVAAIRAKHDRKGAAQKLRAGELQSEEFKGLVNVLELCVGARVLLTVNLWTEAGLMNGALGWVKGFVWPDGGNPGSDDVALQAPYYVVVEFDELTLGCEESLTEKDRDGLPKLVERSFFPWEADPVRRKRWVPIATKNLHSNSHEGVAREQFPLTGVDALESARHDTVARPHSDVGSSCELAGSCICGPDKSQALQARFVREGVANP
jgi:hypothetical protein